MKHPEYPKFCAVWDYHDDSIEIREESGTVLGSIEGVPDWQAVIREGRKWAEENGKPILLWDGAGSGFTAIVEEDGNYLM